MPILLQKTELVFNEEFLLDIHLKRINPGDSSKTVRDIVKITSGSCEVASQFVDKLYSSIITAGTHRVKSIKIAESAKLIENIQRCKYCLN